MQEIISGTSTSRTRLTTTTKYDRSYNNSKFNKLHNYSKFNRARGHSNCIHYNASDHPHCNRTPCCSPMAAVLLAPVPAGPLAPAPLFTLEQL